MKKVTLLTVASLWIASPALAQSTAQPVVPGYLTTSGCSYGMTSCFVQYGSAAPISGTVTANQGTAGSQPWPVKIDQTTPGTTNGVQVNAALPAGANVIGHVITDTTSTTAVTQATAASLNATVVGTGTLAVQNTAATPAGSNIIGNVRIDQTTPGTTNGVVINSGTTTVTQATGTNLHAVLDTTSTTAVTQATGTNLHAVLDTTSTTAVTQATAANLNATVVGGGTAGDTQALSSRIGSYALSQVYNGSSADVSRAVNGASAGTGVGVSAVGIVPTTSSNNATLDSHCTAACASTIVATATHNLYGLNFSSTATGWLLLYNATTCSADGAVAPLRAYAYPTANATVAVSWGSIPLAFSTGIAACFSTTGPYTATASTTAFIALDYK